MSDIDQQCVDDKYCKDITTLSHIWVVLKKIQLFSLRDLPKPARIFDSSNDAT